MLVLEPIRGLRMVADPGALDRARWAGADVLVLRFATDDALAIGATDVELDDTHAIVEDERGYVGTWIAVEEVARHAEWPLPTARPALTQGAIAGVPAKVWLPAGDDGRALLVVAGAASAVLAARLGRGRP